MPPPPVTSHKSSESTYTEPSGSIKDTLQNMCKLPRAELEKMVAEIVHEENFSELVSYVYLVYELYVEIAIV